MNKTSLTLFLYSLLILAFSQQELSPPTDSTSGSSIIDVPAINIPPPVVIFPEDEPSNTDVVEPVDVEPVEVVSEEYEFVLEEAIWEEEGMLNEEYDNIEDVDWSSPPALAEEPSLAGDVDPFKPVVINPEGDVVVTGETKM